MLFDLLISHSISIYLNPLRPKDAYIDAFVNDCALVELPNTWAEPSKWASTLGRMLVHAVSRGMFSAWPRLWRCWIDTDTHISMMLIQQTVAHDNIAENMG